MAFKDCFALPEQFCDGHRFAILHQQQKSSLQDDSTIGLARRLCQAQRNDFCLINTQRAPEGAYEFL